jgi:hypothetical protein
MKTTAIRNAILALALAPALIVADGVVWSWGSPALAGCVCNRPPPSRGGGPAAGPPLRPNIPSGPTMGPPRIPPPVNAGIRAAQDAAANATRQVTQSGPDTALVIDNEIPGESVPPSPGTNQPADPTVNPGDPIDPGIPDRMVDTVREWERETGVKVVNGIDPNNPIPHVGMETVDMGRFIKDEEGTVKPMRTGGEVDMYNRIKEFIRTREGNERMDIPDLLRVSLNTTPNNGDGTIDAEDAYLTAHNVIRILARPEQWSKDPHTASNGRSRAGDPALPIMLDVLGVKSSDGNPTLFDERGQQAYFPPGYVKQLQTIKAEMAEHGVDIRTMTPDDFARALEAKNGTRPPPKVPRDPQYSTDLFSQENGVFVFLPGAERGSDPRQSAHYNGGNHYYFWVGTMTETYGGPAAVVGVTTLEGIVKVMGNEGTRARVQIPYAYSGASSANSVGSRSPTAQPLATPTPFPN